VFTCVAWQETVQSHVAGDIPYFEMDFQEELCTLLNFS